MVYAAMTQIIYRYDSQYILSDSHGRTYNMRDWDSLQVPALAYDSLVWIKPEQSCHTNWTLNLLVGVMKKKLLLLYRIYAYITSFTVFGVVHFLMRIIFVTSVTKQRRQFEYHQFSHC